GAAADDRWNSLTTGVRTDWSRGRDAVMAQGSFSTSESRPNWKQLFSPSPADAPSTAGVSDVRSNTVMGRWAHTQSDGSVFQAQAFRTSRLRDESTLSTTEDVNDVELQYRTVLAVRHDLVFGAGYRADDLHT